MTVVTFNTGHIFDPESSAPSQNILALLHDPANYAVRVNSTTEWIVELIPPVQGVVFVVFAGQFAPNAGSTPPGGTVAAIGFLDASSTAVASFTGLALAPASVAADATLLVSGADTFIGSAANDVFHAGAGDDNEIFGGAGDDSLFGEAGHDVLFGQAGADALFGGDGDDVLVGDGTPAGADPSGNDILDGGAGRDFITYEFATGAVTVNLASEGGYQDTGGGGLDWIISVEEVVGSRFNDHLIGAPDRYDGMAGLAGEDDMDGGDGAARDLISYEYDPNGATINLATGQATDGWRDAAHPHGYADRITGFEDATGSQFNDTITGDGNGNVIRALGGNDTVLAGDGDDWIEGGAGDDRLEGGAGADLIGGQIGNDRILPGVTLGGVVDRVFGGDGASDTGFDTLDYSNAGAAVVVDLSGRTTSGGQLVTLFTGIESVVGSRFDDRLIGNAANNLLTGGAGADLLEGGGGDDAFLQGSALDGIDQVYGGTATADAGFDTINYALAAAGVIVDLSGRVTNAAGTTLANLYGIEAAVGSNFNDVLIGTAGANRFTGGSGADWILGGGGDDWMVQGIDSGVDFLFGDAGVDTIDYGAATSAVTVQLDAGAARSGAALLANLSGVENAVGSAFNDALIGSASNNVLTGGAGADALVGGGGADRFVYRGSDGDDVILDFSRAEGDLIDLSAIDANVVQAGDQQFVFSTARTAGLVGELVVTNSADSSIVSLYLDSDNIADQLITVFHSPGLALNAADFIL